MGTNMTVEYFEDSMGKLLFKSLQDGLAFRKVYIDFSAVRR